MTAYVFPTRRMLLSDLGKAGLAIVVLGTAACARQEEAGGEPTSTGASPSTTQSTETTPTSIPGSTSSTSRSAGGFEWERADLGFVSAYILYRAGEAALVDTGVADSEASIEAALFAVGLGWDSIGHVVVTHKHPDHQGSLAAVLGAAGDAPWYAGAGDMGSISAATEGIPVADGDLVFDLEIVESPGHTPGHISVLDRVGGILVVGDALNGDNGRVVGPNAQFSEDMTAANASVMKLAGFEYEVILFGHGEPVISGGSAQVAELAASLG